MRTYQTSNRPDVYPRVVSDIGPRREMIEDGLRCPNLQWSVYVLRSFGTEECYRDLGSSDATEIVITNLLQSRLSLRAYHPAPRSRPDSQGSLRILEVNRCGAAGLEQTLVRNLARPVSSSRFPRTFHRD